jgi:adenylate cyclase
MSGPEINANEIETVLRGVPLRDTPGWLEVVLVVVLGLVAPLAALRLTSGWVLAVVLGAAAALAGGVWAAFQSGRVAPVAAPALALGLGGLAALAVGGFYATLARERARTLFARFVAEPVVDEVLAHTVGDLRLGGVRVDATIMFCDLRGSTTLLERMEPERGLEVLNVFLSQMADAVLDQGGTLLGYRGDGLLAIFGAPLPQPDQADRALRAALDMAGPRLEACNAWLREQAPGVELRMGVGIHSGEVMAGNVGSEARMEYTAIGDPVNVAARVEGLTKEAGHVVLVTDATRERLSASDGLLVRVGRRPVRGRAEGVELWAPAIEP